MKFSIDRTTNGWSCEEKPYKTAVKEKTIRIDERTVSKPPMDKRWGQVWYDDGRNHRVENGHIKRDFDSEVWFVEVETLEELLDLSKKAGDDIIISCGDIPHIEIYDDYRE